MPLYTYVASYRGAIHADQGRFSNFKGFAAGVMASLPPSALPGLSAALRRDLLDRAPRCEWIAVPNRSGLWRTAFDLDGSEFVIHAVLSRD